LIEKITPIERDKYFFTNWKRKNQVIKISSQSKSDPVWPSQILKEAT